MYTSHDSLFVSNIDRDQMILVIFLMYETLKGEASFWHSYIDYLEPEEVPPCYWDKTVMDKSDYAHFLS